MWTVSLPIRILLPRKKKDDVIFDLNLNTYRNTHYLILNEAKIRYKEIVTPLIKHIPKLEGCGMDFVLYPGSRRLCDVSNICSIVEKFFNDAFVEAGKIEDDNYLFIPVSRYNFGAVDVNNPRVDLTIEPILKE